MDSAYDAEAHLARDYPREHSLRETAAEEELIGYDAVPATRATSTFVRSKRGEKNS